MKKMLKSGGAVTGEQGTVRDSDSSKVVGADDKAIEQQTYGDDKTAAVVPNERCAAGAATGKVDSKIAMCLLYGESTVASQASHTAHTNAGDRGKLGANHSYSNRKVKLETVHGVFGVVNVPL
uniref:Cell-division control histidine kinase pdhS n=1 Tax=Lygus hesperus TaxID=30085 RepID=A0A0A9ZB62_LYGHE